MLDSQYLESQNGLLGDRIKHLRIKAGFNSKHDLGVIYTGSEKKSSVISRIEKGANMQMKTIVRLAIIFKMPVYCFFDFNGRFRVTIHERYNTNLEERLSDVLVMIGNNIKKLRKARKWSQLDLDIATGIDRGTLAKYEVGSENIKYESLVIIAHAFEVEVLHLFRA